MSLATDFVSTLSATFSGRLYPSVAPASAGTELPYAVYQQVSGAPETFLDETGTLTNVHVQLTIMGRDKLTIDALKEAAKGVMDSASPFAAIVRNEMDLFEEPQILYAVMVEFSLWRN